jgi:hypothetical protein
MATVSDPGGTTSREEREADEGSRHRKIISEVLLAALIATSFHEMVEPVTEAFKEVGIDIQSLAWPLIYLLTVLRFFAGYVVHFGNPDLAKRKAAPRWFFDLSFVVAQWSVLIFAGAVTSLQASDEAVVSFTDYLIVLYAIDIVWVFASHLLHWLGLMERESDLPRWEWAVVNLLLCALTLWLAIGHPASIPGWGLWVLLFANLIVFFYDIFGAVLDIREPEETKRELRPWLRRLLRRASGGSGGAG